MFSPIVPRCQPAARNVEVKGEPHGVWVNCPHAPIRASLSRAARSSVRLRRSERRPARWRARLIIRRMLATPPPARAAVKVAAGAAWSGGDAAWAAAPGRARETTATAAAAREVKDLLMPPRTARLDGSTRRLSPDRGRRPPPAGQPVLQAVRAWSSRRAGERRKGATNGRIRRPSGGGTLSAPCPPPAGRPPPIG